MDNLMPHNLEAERTVIGNILIDNNCMTTVEEFLTKDDFYQERHQILFEHIQYLISKGVADIITLTNRLKEQKLMEKIGGSYVISDLIVSSVSSSYVQHYCEIVKNKSIARTIIKNCKEIQRRTLENEFISIQEILDFAQGKAFSIEGHMNNENSVLKSMDIVRSTMMDIESRYQNKNALLGLSSGFKNLDHLTQGFKPGEVIVVAARPSMGKTAFSLNLTLNIAQQNKKVLYFSVEMPKDLMMLRMLATQARIDLSRLSAGAIKPNEWSHLIQSASLISEYPIFIDDTSGLSPFELKSRARWVKSKYGLDCIVVDYLQLMKLKQNRFESREREVAEISMALKAIAKELKIPVISLAQLNREADKRVDRRPIMSDLRDSGSIEMDADIIMMLFREEYYERNNPDVKGLAEVIVGKNRNGKTGTANMKFVPEFNLFSEGNVNSSH